MDFHTLADIALNFIIDTIERDDPDGNIDIDYHGDIVNLSTVSGMFIINKHSAAKEIWLVSPITGPYHFSYLDGSWLARGDVNLFELLSKELNISFI